MNSDKPNYCLYHGIHADKLVTSGTVRYSLTLLSGSCYDDSSKGVGVLSKEMVKDTKDKIADFKRFSFVLLSLSAFLYIGSIIPFEGKQTLHKLILLGTSYLSLGIALVFYRKISQWKKQLNEES